MVKGINMMVSKEVLAEITKLLAEGAKWIDKHVFLYSGIEVF